ncbi:MAG: hypothetical protein LBB16_00005, partial [Puniceicoccales bacterium]|nr:hypothetical protein [Puniceicoccales bacterium]
MFRRFLIFSIFILSYFPTITKASDYSPIIFEENHIDISNFDARWEPYSKKWGMELDTIRSLFAGEEFFLVPCIRSQDDFKTYFEIRNNQNGDLEHIKFYEDGKRKTEGECKITYDR